MFKFVFCATNRHQKNPSSPFSLTIALLCCGNGTPRMLSGKRFVRTFRFLFSPAKSKLKQALNFHLTNTQYDFKKDIK